MHEIVLNKSSRACVCVCVTIWVRGLERAEDKKIGVNSDLQGKPSYHYNLTLHVVIGNHIC